MKVWAVNVFDGCQCDYQQHVLDKIFDSRKKADEYVTTKCRELGITLSVQQQYEIEEKEIE